MMTAAVIWGFYLASPYRREERAAIQLARPQVMDIRDTVTLQGTVIDPERKKVYLCCNIKCQYAQAVCLHYNKDQGRAPSGFSHFF